MLIARGLIVFAAAPLVAVQVVRNTAVASFARLQPEAAARFWSGHPSVETSGGLTAIARAAREGRPIDPAIFAVMNGVAAKAPLAPEPYLVRGVQAQMSGDADAARRAFLAAQLRDPRSLPAAYFLADHYFRTGQPLRGLAQTAVLARLAPNGAGAVAPYVAAFARNRANWDEIRAVFKTQEGLESGVLNALAQDAGNADAILALAEGRYRRPDSEWVPILLNSLINAGDYARARAVWLAVGAPRQGAMGLIYDAGFSAPGAPPPFNWNLATSVGMAEREPGGRLHAIFYGNQDGVLASQLLMLRPGAYRLQLQLAVPPSHPETLSWSIRCDRSAQPLASAGIEQIAKGGWTFQVPANCGAQWLELTGRSGDVGQQAEVTIGTLRLARVGGNA